MVEVPSEEQDDIDGFEKTDPVSHPDNGVGTFFGAALAPESLNADMDSIIARLPKKPSELLQKSMGIELEQQQFWQSKVSALAISAGLTSDSNDLVGLDVMRDKATELIGQHLFIERLGSHTFFRLVLGGPARSGKTTFFGILIQHLILALIGYGRWKRICLFIFNGDHIAAAANNPRSLHRKIVELTIAAIVAQVPKLIPHETMLRRYFDRAIDRNATSVLPRSFTQAPETQVFAKACADIAGCLQTHWSDPEGGERWASLLFRFPVMIAKELGFEDVLFLIDNFDSINMVLRSAPQFESGDIHIGECMKSALKQAQFILSYHDTADFDNCMLPLADGLVDFQTELKYFSTLDLDCIAEYENKIVNVDAGGMSLTLTADHFGATPSYLKQWYVLIEILLDMENAQDDQEAVDDALSEAITHAGKVLPLVFGSNHAFGEVEDVRLRSA
jgi:hypothetical protein